MAPREPRALILIALLLIPSALWALDLVREARANPGPVVIGSISIPSNLIQHSPTNYTLYSPALAINVVWDGTYAYCRLLNPSAPEPWRAYPISYWMMWSFQFLSKSGQWMEDAPSAVSFSNAVQNASGAFLTQVLTLPSTGSTAKIVYKLLGDRLKWDLELTSGRGLQWKFVYRLDGIPSANKRVKSDALKRITFIDLGLAKNLTFAYDDVPSQYQVSDLYDEANHKFFFEISLGALSAGQTVRIDPTIITTTSTYAISGNHQKQIFFDGTYYWVLLHNYYYYSSDGTTWSSAAESLGGRYVSIWVDGTTIYAVYTYLDPSGYYSGPRFRKGTKSGTTITWGSEVWIDSIPVSDDCVFEDSCASICKATDGKLWVAYFLAYVQYCIEATYYYRKLNVKYSADDGATWSDAEVLYSSYNYGTPNNNYLCRPAIVPLANGTVMVIVNRNGNLYSYLSSNNWATYTIDSTVSGSMDTSFSAIGDPVDGKARVLFQDSDGTIDYAEWTGSGWAVTNAIASAGKYPLLTKLSGGYVALWCDSASPPTSISYRRLSNSGAWDPSPTTLVSGRTNGIYPRYGIQSNYEFAATNQLMLFWSEKASSPYDLVFEKATITFTTTTTAWVYGNQTVYSTRIRSYGGLVGYWRLDEGSGTTAADSSGNGNTGTLVNGPTWVSGRYGNALSFDGADDRVQLTSQPPLTDGFSFAAWVKRAGGTTHQEIFNNNQFFVRIQPYSEDSNQPFEAFVKLSDESIEPRANSGVASTPGTWFFIVVTWDKNYLKIYVNGELKGSSARAGNLTSTTVTAQIGAGEQTTLTCNYWNGTIDEVRIYNRALSADEVLRLYQGYEVGWITTTLQAQTTNLTTTTSALATTTSTRTYSATVRATAIARTTETTSTSFLTFYNTTRNTVASNSTSTTATVTTTHTTTVPIGTATTTAGDTTIVVITNAVTTVFHADYGVLVTPWQKFYDLITTTIRTLYGLLIHEEIQVLHDPPRIRPGSISVNGSYGTQYPFIGFNATYLAYDDPASGATFYAWDGNRCVGTAMAGPNGLVNLQLNCTLHGSGVIKLNGTGFGLPTASDVFLPYNISISQPRFSSLPSNWKSGESCSISVSFVNQAHLNNTALKIENCRIRVQILSQSGAVICQSDSTLFDIPTGTTEAIASIFVSDIPSSGFYTLKAQVIQFGSEWILGEASAPIYISVGTGGGGGGSTTLPSLSLMISKVQALSVKPGGSAEADIPISFSGSTTASITSVDFSGPGSEWLSVVSQLPLRLEADASGGRGSIRVRVSPPPNAKPGSYKVSVLLKAESAGSLAQASAPLEFSVEPSAPAAQPSGGAAFGGEEMMLLAALGGFVALLVLSAKPKRRAR